MNSNFLWTNVIGWEWTILSVHKHDIYNEQTGENNIYSTCMRANNIGPCTFSRFNEKWLRNDWEMTDKWLTNDWQMTDKWQGKKSLHSKEVCTNHCIFTDFFASSKLSLSFLPKVANFNRFSCGKN